MIGEGPSSRRMFFSQAAAAAAGSAALAGNNATAAAVEAVGAAPTSAPPAGNPYWKAFADRLASLSVADFEPLVGTEFAVDAGSQDTVSLTLVEASPLGRTGLPAASPKETREPFSLMFLGPRSPLLEQNSYPIAHATIGSLPLFIVPVAPTRDFGTAQYQAIFS
jgi:hypothetical protein